MSSIIQRLICMPRFLSLSLSLFCVCVCAGGMLKWQRAFPFPASALHMAAHVPCLLPPLPIEISTGAKVIQFNVEKLDPKKPSIQPVLI